MNAVLKPSIEQEFAELFSFEDNLPADFFTNPIYDQRLDHAIELTSNLVYPINDEGEKQAKADATSINKFAKAYDGFIAAVYKSQTEEITAWRTSKKDKTKRLLENRQALIDQFAEARQKKLDSIRSQLELRLAEEWNEKGVKAEFQNGDIEPILSLTAITPKGALTKKANDFISGIVAGNLAEQQRIEARHLLIENRCLREDINPPLTYAHMGEAFNADDEAFNAKLEQLIVTEKERKAEMEERIRKAQELDNQRKIDAALKEQQAEANRIAREKAEAERKPEPAPQTSRDEAAELREKAAHIEQAAHRADRNADRNRELAQAAELRKQADELEAPRPGKRTVMVTATFAFNGISERVSNAGVEKFFVEQLSEKLQSILSSTESRDA